MKASRSLRFMSTIIVIFFSIQLFCQTVQTSKNTYKLVPVVDFKDPSVARSARAVAEMAIPAVISDSKKIAQKREALQPEIDNYMNDLNRYNTDLDLYNISLDSYNNNLDAYDNELARYEGDLYPHNAAVDTYDNLPEESRTQAEYDRLIASKNRLDSWLARLDQQKAGLDESHTRLDNHKKDLDYTYASLNSRYEYLQYQLNDIDIELGKAYDQLEMLITYSEECNKILKEWSEPVLDTYNLNTQLEQLKALSNKGWN